MAFRTTPGITLFIFLICLMLTAVSGCNLEQFIFGTVTLSDMSAGNYIIVILDDDRDPTEGYLSRTAVEIIYSAVPVQYILDTTGIDGGAFFLVAGYNSDSSVNEPTSWTARGWYGADPPSEPNEANVMDLTGQYDIALARPVL